MNIKKICITNRQLVSGDYFKQIERALNTDIYALILREKDLSAKEYLSLAKKVLKLCEKYDKMCVLHTYTDVAIELGCRNIHLTMKDLRELTEDKRECFDIVGASTHTVDEALEAQKLSATYITASHIYETQCKAGLKPRGLDYLKEAVTAVDIPVYALGGVHYDNMAECISCGAAGVCMMSEYMY